LTVRETCNIAIPTMAAWLLSMMPVVAKGEEPLAPATAAADIRIEGHEVLMNGEPYVPFGLVDHCEREEYRRIKNFGINSVSIDSLFRNVQPDGSMKKEIESLREDLDEAQKNGLTVLVLLGGAAPPDWLFERYPNCRMKKADGSDQMKFTWTQYTLNHSGTRKELKHYFEGVVNGLKDHPALLGWLLWNEPYLLLSVDYHPATIAQFQKWLAEKYKEIDKLNTAWLSSYARFDDIKAPADRHSATPVAWTDWMYFRQDNFADFFRWQTRIIRNIDPHHVVTTKIRKPLDLRDDSAGQRAVNTRMWAESFCDTVGFDPYPLLDDAHEVRLFADFMRGMSLGKPMWDTEAAFVPYGERGRPSPETYQSAFWMKFARGVNGTWFYEWAPIRDSPLAFTFYPGGDPVPTIYTIAECSRLLAKYKILLSKGRIVPPQVAVLHSTSTQWHHHGEFTTTADLTTVINCLYRKHIPYDYIAESDIADGALKKFQALVVVGTRNISDQLLSEIRKYIEAGGHVLANVRFAEFDEYGRRRASYPPEWLGVRSRKWVQSPRKKVGTLQLERKAIDHHRQPVDVKVILDTFDSRPMHISMQSPMIGLPVGTVIGSGDLYGYEGRDQLREELKLLDGAEVVATFEDNTPAIVTTPRTMYIARDTCWLSHNFADLIESFMLNAGVVRLAYARDESGDEVAPLDLVLCETPDRYVLYVTNLPQTLRYDGSPSNNVHVGMPGAGAPMDLFRGTQLKSRQLGKIHEVKLDLSRGQTRILVSRRTRPPS